MSDSRARLELRVKNWEQARKIWEPKKNYRTRNKKHGHLECHQLAALAPALLERVGELLGALRAQAVVVQAQLAQRVAAARLEELGEGLEADGAERVVRHVDLD